MATLAPDISLTPAAAARVGRDRVYLTEADRTGLHHFTRRLGPKGRYRRAE